MTIGAANASKDKQVEVVKTQKKPDFMQTQTVSLGHFKKFGSEATDGDSEQSPALQYSRN